MYSLVSQREQAGDGQREAFEDTLTDQYIVHAALLHVGGGAEYQTGNQ